MKFRILTARGDDRQSWSGLVSRLPPEFRDLHFLPEYGEIFCGTYGHDPLLAHLEGADNFVIQPFVRRGLNDLPFLAQQHVAEPYFDIASVYGYGGPLCLRPEAKSTPALLTRFNEEFHSWCVSQHIASEFCCLHPLLGNHVLVAGWPAVQASLEKHVVYLDLTLSETDLWRGIHRGHRSSIQHARKNGVRVERVVANAENVRLFEQLYRTTMDRHDAAEKWYFPDGHLLRCAQSLGPERSSLFFAWAGGRVASAFLVLHDSAIAYYLYGGSDEAFFPLRPNNLLHHEIALWAKREGCRMYHIGGGVTPDSGDSLLRFKSGFGGITAPLYTYGRVHDGASYNRLCELKKNHERTSPGRILAMDYFPLYRR